MKHTDYFKNFLANTVNMSKFNLELLSQRVDTVYGVLKADDDLGPLVKKKIPQGSWPQKTIIRPQNGKAFDGDFMVQMVENPAWEVDKKKYADAIYRVLHNTSPYKDMPHGRKCRCVYLTYANNAMHLDIVPFVIRADGTQWIINRDDNEWERTDTDGFTAWMKRQDEIAGKHLREVIRIIKFLRDHRNSFTGTRSILLTTLLGEQVKEWRTILDAGYYGDLPTALLHIVSELDDWLQARPTKPTIMDPAGTGTSFDHRWSAETYAYFRDRIHAHAAEIKAAYDETDFDKSVKKWQALFGDGFSAPKTVGAVGKYRALGTGAGSAGASTVSLPGRAG
ncbi:nucleotidyltransferase [Mycobacterium vulneris]|uniref:Nucleotidyltransferase n=1 Tax=Mycolicibacterium vulneris TaxID=547163 RepID=A0A1X2KHY1_9MYCO|nr:nucleotidyltransferase [Mycolicibacterium vulneris]OSC20875.1 nucleotidyltransferase [Mycolicibacterium vulneris]